MKNPKCHICGKEDFKNRKVEYIYRRKGKYMIVRDVPCEVCLHCGERYYPAEALLNVEKRFKAVHENHEQPEELLGVPVEAYSF
jgi:YgiT-type zinc finger domain-containing protein